MSFLVKLYKNTVVDRINKKRSGFDGEVLWEGRLNNNGNFAKLDLTQHNSVEISCKIETVIKSTHIYIEAYGLKIIGEIVNKGYINDNNTVIAYTVDHYTSSLLSGIIEDISGVCIRTNLSLKSLNSNLQSEPCIPSDFCRVNNKLTSDMTKAVAEFTGIAPSWKGLSDENLCFVLTVSSAVAQFLNAEPFSTPGNFDQTLKEVNNFDFLPVDTTLHSGGIFRGTPLRFDTNSDANDFVRRILGGAGFIRKLPPSGMPGQDALNNISIISTANQGGGNTNWIYKNARGESMEALRPFTIDDIYGLYAIPKKFAENYALYFTAGKVFNVYKNLENIHSWGTEPSSSFKLLAYPYNYIRCVTANSDSFSLIPQTHYLDNENLMCWFRFVGGDTPRLQGMFAKQGIGQNTPIQDGAVTEWFTIQSYPAITLSINNSYNPQVQRDMQNTRQQSAAYNNTNQNSSLIKFGPIQFGGEFVEGYRLGEQGQSNVQATNTNYGLGGTATQVAGYAVGRLANLIAPNASEFFLGSKLPNLFKNEGGLSADALRRSQEASNFISPAVSSIMGDDFISQISLTPISCYYQGASENEIWAFARYFEKNGQTTNVVINPINHEKTIFGGEATISPFEGKTYYQFGVLTIKGAIPVEWKQGIESLFINGVYIHD